MAQEWQGEVRIPVESYNWLRSENERLSKENAELARALADLQEKDGQKVIIRETVATRTRTKEIIEKTTFVKGFDEVRTEIEDFYKKKIEDLEEKIADKQQEIVKYSEKGLEQQTEISRLKHRGLWDRIMNN